MVGHCSANFQPILDCFIPNFKLKCKDSENIKADLVNTVVFSIHRIKRLAFFLGHQVVLAGWISLVFPCKNVKKTTLCCGGDSVYQRKSVSSKFFKIICPMLQSFVLAIVESYRMDMLQRKSYSGGSSPSLGSEIGPKKCWLTIKNEIQKDYIIKAVDSLWIFFKTRSDTFRSVLIYGKEQESRKNIS